MIVATLGGPLYRSRELDPRTIEVFANVGEAMLELLARHRSHGRINHLIKSLDGGVLGAVLPGFTVGHWFQCWELGDVPIEALGKHQQEAILHLISRGEWTYYMSLDNDGTDTYVKVRVA